MSYVSLPLQLNAEALVEEAFAVMESNYPGWKPYPGNPEAILIRATVYALAVPLAQLASDVADEIFARYGEEIVKVQPHEARPAQGLVAFAVFDNAGYEIPAGTQVDLERTGSEQVGFRTTAPAVIPPGSSTITEVPIEAIDAGAAGNSLSGDASLVDALGYVESTTLEGSTSSGADAEEASAYLDRLVEVMQTLAPRPIIGRDAAILARSIAGVQRVAVIDNYNAETGEDEQEKTISLAPLDASGQSSSLPVREEIAAMLEALRELNFIFIVTTADSTPVYIEAAVVAAPGFLQSEAVASAEAALAQLLDAALWGTGEQRDRKRWDNTPILRYQDVVTAINNAQGVDHYTTLKIKKEGGSYGTSDVTLDGDFPLPGTLHLAIT